MSKASAETRLALFERMDGRGDVLSIPVEKGAELAALPIEMFAGILYPFFQWWVNGSTEEPSDPRDKMVFAGLKIHQIENAVKRGTNLKAWNKNAYNRGGPHRGTKKPSDNQAGTNWSPSGNQEETKGVQLEVASCKIEDASTSLLSCKSPSRTIASRGGLTPPVRNCTSPEDAKRTLAEYAPPICSHTQCLSASSTPRNPRLTPWASLYNCRNAHAASVMVAARIFPDDLSDIDYEGIDRTGEDGFCFDNYEQGKTDGEAFAAKLCELSAALGEKNGDVFKRALLDAALYACQQEHDAKDEIILGRLNKVLDAVRVLNAE